MPDFAPTLITAIAASVVSVLAFLGLTLVLALYWSSIARRIAPNRFAEPESEKAWPSYSYPTSTASVRESDAKSSVFSSPRSSPSHTPSSSVSSSPPSSPSPSRDQPAIPKAVLRN